MLLNYIKIAIRHILRNKLYSIINIISLSIGMACAILLLLYVQEELTYDKHHEKHERIYRLNSIYRVESGPMKMAVTPLPLGVTLKDEYPQIKEVVRFYPVGKEFFKYIKNGFFEENFFYSDPTIFDVFTHKILKGSILDEFKKPNTMVMTESLAKKYFGDEHPIGKVIKNRQGKNLKVVGTIEDLPGNSHFKFNALISMETLAEEWGRDEFDSRAPAMFEGGLASTYVLLNKGATINSIIDDFDRFREKYFTGSTSQFATSQYLEATPLVKTHFYSDISNDRPHGNIAFIYMLAVLALFFIIISSINYLNMATACASKREKEVGLRKVMGAFRVQLIKQFLMESVIFSIIAFFLSLVLVEMLFSLFKQISGKDLALFNTNNVTLLGLTLLLAIFAGIGSGSYPAIFISRFMPSGILGYSRASLRKSGYLRNLLVVAQFTISIVVLIATSVVFKQADYMKNKDLGFDKEDIVIQKVGIRGESIQTSIDILKKELKRSPFILDTAASTGSVDGTIAFVHHLVEIDGKMKEMVLSKLAVDYNYFDLMGIDLKQGRNFSQDILTDRSQAFIINETTAKKTGWGNDAIGKRIQFDSEFDGKFDGPDDVYGRVIGLVRDFHIYGLQKEIYPCVISVLKPLDPVDSITIKIKPGNTAEALGYIDRKTRELNADTPPDYFFLEEKLSEFYLNEEQLVNILGSFSIISILISCMGLIGLSSYVAEQRTKEIGIRKVLGAKISGIIFQLSKGFLILVLIANIIAWPIAYYAMNGWLENYAYRINLGLYFFVLAALAAFMTAFFTVSFQAIKSASKDPVKALRYE